MGSADGRRYAARAMKSKPAASRRASKPSAASSRDARVPSTYIARAQPRVRAAGAARTARATARGTVRGFARRSSGARRRSRAPRVARRHGGVQEALRVRLLEERPSRRGVPAAWKQMSERLGRLTAVEDLPGKREFQRLLKRAMELNGGGAGGAGEEGKARRRDAPGVRRRRWRRRRRRGSSSRRLAEQSSGGIGVDTRREGGSDAAAAGGAGGGVDRGGQGAELEVRALLTRVGGGLDPVAAAPRDRPEAAYPRNAAEVCACEPHPAEARLRPDFTALTSRPPSGVPETRTPGIPAPTPRFPPEPDPRQVHEQPGLLLLPSQLRELLSTG